LVLPQPLAILAAAALAAAGYRMGLEPGAILFPALLPILPYPTAAAAFVAAVLAAGTRNPRFGMAFAALALPCGVFLIVHPGLLVLLSTAAAGVTLVFAYKDALRRL
jgi:hypothetical protein